MLTAISRGIFTTILLYSKLQIIQDLPGSL